MKAVIYELATGRIVQVVNAPASHISAQCPAGCSYVLSATGTDHGHYVEIETGWVRAKGDYTLEALPLPCMVMIEGVEYACDTQPEFSFEQPGDYVISVDAGVGYLRKEFVYHAD